MQAITTIATPGETAALCHSVGVSRATLYRQRRPAPPPRPRAPSPRALGPTERQAVLDVLHSPRFVDQSPTEVHATLLEEQTYLCSPRTMYRVLAAAHEVRERRAQARHPAYAAPELVATGPRSGPGISPSSRAQWYLYYSLYVILDLFSRYVVGWMVARPRMRTWPSACWRRPARSRASRRTNSPFTRTAVRPCAAHSSRCSSRTWGQSFAAPREQRQSVLRSAVPDREVPAGVSGTVRRARTRAWRQPRPVCVVQRRAPSQRPELSDARRRPLRPRRNGPGGPSGRLCRPSRAFVHGPPRPETMPTAVWINRPPTLTSQVAPATTTVTPGAAGLHAPATRIDNRPGTLVTSVESLQ